MIKKLDKLILKAFIGPFLATFFIAYFVLMMQSLWKYIDDLVGKGLELAIIGKFLWYASASMLTLAMPIAILISTIMTFGNLGERFELVAIKSSGISLLRFMRPLLGVSIILCIVTFVFANYVIPNANFKFKALYYSILYKKPALDLREGKFYNAIPGYSIKVGKKEPDGKTIRDVVIFEQQNNLQDNCIIAKKGIMQFSKDERFLEFTLYDGHRYQEKGSSYDTATEYTRLDFAEYKKVFDIASIQLMAPPDSMFKSDMRSMSVKELDKSIDSLNKLAAQYKKVIDADFKSQLQNIYISDSVWNKNKYTAGNIKSFNQIVPDSVTLDVNRNAVSVLNTMKSTMMFSGNELAAKIGEIRLNRVEWHHKFSLSLICLVLFFIGAPLGSIIRRGGLGMPLVMAIIFFLIFHLLNLFGEKFARGDVMPPSIGMWLPEFVLIPIGIFLTYKAMYDSQLFNKEFYYRLFITVSKRIKLIKPKSSES